MSQRGVTRRSPINLAPETPKMPLKDNSPPMSSKVASGKKSPVKSSNCSLLQTSTYDMSIHLYCETTNIEFDQENCSQYCSNKSIKSQPIQKSPQKETKLLPETNNHFQKNPKSEVIIEFPETNNEVQTEENDDEESVEIETTCEQCCDCEEVYGKKLIDMQEKYCQSVDRLALMADKYEYLLEAKNKAESDLCFLQAQLEEKNNQNMQEESPKQTQEWKEKYWDLWEECANKEKELQMAQGNTKTLETRIEELQSKLEAKDGRNLEEEVKDLKKEKDILFEGFARLTEENKTLRGEINHLQKQLEKENMKVQLQEERQAMTEKFINTNLSYRSDASPDKQSIRYTPKRTELPISQVQIPESDKTDCESFRDFKDYKDLKDPQENLSKKFAAINNQSSIVLKDSTNTSIPMKKAPASEEVNLNIGDRKCSRRQNRFNTQQQTDKSETPRSVSPGSTLPTDIPALEKTLSETEKLRSSLCLKLKQLESVRPRTGKIVKEKADTQDQIYDQENMITNIKCRIKRIFNQQRSKK